MTSSLVFRPLGPCLVSILALSACDNGGGAKAARDASTDAGETEDAALDSGDDASAQDDDSSVDASESAADASDAAKDAAEDPYQCRPAPAPDGTIEQGASCCAGLGVCITVDVDAGSTLSIGDCNAAQNLRCLPTSAAGDAAAGSDGGADGGTRALSTCRMRLAGAEDGGTDYEGRCLPECLTRGASGLEQGECKDEFVCVPCYSPVTGVSTAACSGAGDHPVDPAPPGWAECGERLGYCTPSSAITQPAAMLQQLSCEQDEVCAPKSRVLAPDSCFAHCSSLFGPGACLPAFLIPEASRGFLQPDRCASGELCSPCLDPSTRMPTRACD